MSVKIMSLVWERAPYTAGSLLVFLALADWANDDGVAWPSMERLAEKARLDKRSAQRIVRQLQKDGMLIIEEGGGRSKQHRFYIQTERVTNCHRLKGDVDVTVSDVKGGNLNAETVTFEAERVTSEAQTVTPVSPDPSVEPLVDPPVDPKEQQRGTRLPDDFSLNSSMREWATTNAPHVDLVVAIDEFRDYWRGIPGARGRKLDWPATWRNRMRELEGRAARNSNGRKSTSDRNVTNIKDSLAYLDSLDDKPSQLTS